MFSIFPKSAYSEIKIFSQNFVSNQKDHRFRWEEMLKNAPMVPFIDKPPIRESHIGGFSTSERAFYNDLDIRLFFVYQCLARVVLSIH